MTDTRHPERYESNRFPTLREAMQQLFDESFWDPFETTARFPDAVHGGFPRVDISDDADNVYVTANVPGVDPEQIDIEADEDTLTLSGEISRAQTDTDADRNYYRYEREYGTFRRTIPLPAPVKSADARATSQNGVLSVTLPKAAGEKRTKIQINAQ